MRSPALLLGICLLGLGPMAAVADPVPVPMPAPKPKSGTVPPPAAAIPSGKPKAQAQLLPAQSTGSTLFPFKIPGFGSGPTNNLDANQRALVDRVNIYLMSVQTLTGDFVQIAPDGRRSEGKVYLQKPGRIRFEYNPPSPMELVSDGSSLVVRDRKLETQDLYPLSQTPLRFLLADRIDLTKDTSVIAVSSKDMQLKQWTITDPQGFDTTVALYNLDPTKKLDPGMFKINYERKEIIQ